MAVERPVFIHSLWRSCGTYIFNKFRQDAAYHAYFEPCSEFLTASSSDAVSATIPDELRPNLRHTGALRQSFEAFPFAEAGGVCGFNERFAYDRFHLAADATDFELQRYISILIEHAASHGRTAVAKCCRFGLRAEWLNRIFNPVTIYIVRNPDAIFRSYWSFGGCRSYFLAASLLIVARNRESPVFAELADELRLPSLSDRPLSQALADAFGLTSALSPQDLRDLMLLLWVVTFAHSVRGACAVLDVDMLLSSHDYRRASEARLRELVGRSFSFADARPSEVQASPGRTVSQRGALCARHALTVVGKCHGGRWTLSDQSQEVLDLLL